MHEAACKNTLRVMGSRQDVKLFQDWASTPDSPISLAKALPVPEDLLKLDPNLLTPTVWEKYGALDPMTWKDDNWGTYVDFDQVQIKSQVEFDKTETQELSEMMKNKHVVEEAVAPEIVIVYSYLTPCVPPLHAYRNFSEAHPNLMFHASFDVDTHNEHGHETSGFLLVKAGKMLKRWFNPISFNSLKIHMGVSDDSIESDEFNTLMKDNKKIQGEEDDD